MNDVPHRSHPEDGPTGADDAEAARPDAQRRRLLGGIAASTALLGAAGSAVARTLTASSLPAPADCGIDHFVVVMMENRSFDHMLGWVPGADGMQAGLSFPDASGELHATHDLAPDYQNCSSADPDHSYDGGRTQADGSLMNGFLLTQPAGDTFPIGYYTAATLPFYAGCATDWTICDHYFSGILSCTFPNRIYMHAGQTDRVDNTTNICHLPTVWDSLQAVGATGRYYFSDLPITALWGTKLKSISFPFSQFKADAAAGTLPSVSYVDPSMLGEDTGVSKDDHPFADVRDGQAFLASVYNILRASPNWSRTLLIINYDEWGGFFDHVSPPSAPVTPQEYAATGNDGRLGIRVPCIAIGPHARRGHVETQQFDTNSILNMFAWRFGFAPLGARASSTNFAYALDFGRTVNTRAAAIRVPAGPFGGACEMTPNAAVADTATHFAEVMRRRDEHIAELKLLRARADSLGFAKA